MMQVSSNVVMLQKEVSRTFILSNNHSPCKIHWNLAVKRALQIINRSSTPLIKVLYKHNKTLFIVVPASFNIL